MVLNYTSGKKALYNVLMVRSNAALGIRFNNVRSLWPFVNKIEQSVVNFGWSILLSSHFAKFQNKNPHTSVFYNLIPVLFLCLWVVVFSFPDSLSSADKKEEGKDMFERQIHAWWTSRKWLLFLIHENKLLHEV